jgi:hypothetical protein
MQKGIEKDLWMLANVRYTKSFTNPLSWKKNKDDKSLSILLQQNLVLFLARNVIQHYFAIIADGGVDPCIGRSPCHTID